MDIKFLSLTMMITPILIAISTIVICILMSIIINVLEKLNVECDSNLAMSLAVLIFVFLLGLLMYLIF